MVVDQVNVASRARLFAIAENQAPVTCHSQTPESLPVSFERVQPPSRKPAELSYRLRGFDGEHKLAQLVGHGGWHSFCAARFMKLAEPFMAKADEPHILPL